MTTNCKALAGRTTDFRAFFSRIEASNCIVPFIYLATFVLLFPDFFDSLKNVQCTGSDTLLLPKRWHSLNCFSGWALCADEVMTICFECARNCLLGGMAWKGTRKSNSESYFDGLIIIFDLRLADEGPTLWLDQLGTTFYATTLMRKLKPQIRNTFNEPTWYDGRLSRWRAFSSGVRWKYWYI